MTSRLIQVAKHLARNMSDIHLYTSQTPNGIKASIALEELGLKYQTTSIELQKNTQKEPWFLEVNPNGRIPALTDKLESGETIRIFESGSILQYLVDRYDGDHKISYPRGTKEYYETNNWLFWQMGGLGPMQGQLNHFNRYAPEKIPYGISRYLNESRRLYKVMETQLQKTPFLVGEKCTIADISCWGWVAAAAWAGIDMGEFPELKSWVDRCLARPGFEKGRHVPTKHTALEQAKLSQEEIEKRAKEASAWIVQGMKDDAK